MNAVVRKALVRGDIREKEITQIRAALKTGRMNPASIRVLKQRAGQLSDDNARASAQLRAWKGGKADPKKYAELKRYSKARNAELVRILEFLKKHS